ncbi:MAG TPA: aspartyl/asparaginyl beta-hydroxylase domain-containing protein [Pseudomonadales bacterium]
MGDLTAALRDLDAVLALDPYHFLALLSKGALLEQRGLARRAAAVYKDALTIAPKDDQLPQSLAGPVARARAAVAEHSRALREHLEERLRPLRRQYVAENLERFDEAVDIMAGTTRAYVQQPVMLHYPRLPAIPFYDRALFPWLTRLEAQTATIREELLGVLDAAEDDLVPYVAYPPGTPVNQWGELNHSRRWSSYFLWRDGIRQESACARCPKTAALLDELPLARQEGFAPTAMYSVLAPRTVIPPHTGSINTRLIVHLPLILPSGCRFRVGNVTREWRLGEAWVFDDTIEHEARNDSDERRVILIFDVWNPFLSEAERELLTVMLQAKNEYFALDAPLQ